MKQPINKVLFALVLLWSLGASSQISHFQHVVVVFQENRTPDNLFQGLCSAPFGANSSCNAVSPTNLQYNIQTSNWLDRESSTSVTQPTPVPLANAYDLGHGHPAFVAECDKNLSGECQMDGAADVPCWGNCPPNPQFGFVDNSTGTIDPYLSLATQYGWANYMFQTNQGPSFPAHQFIFGGTSAPDAANDAAGIFASENRNGGCMAPPGNTVQLISPSGEQGSMYPCFEHQTMGDLLDAASKSWKYYTPSAGSIWTAPNAINHICVPTQPVAGQWGQCTGASWLMHVDLDSKDALIDIGNCDLPDVSWIIPSGYNSDHAGSNRGGGPAWVGSIVNAIGNSPCRNPDGSSYWNSTAILISWDDWGGWYDHVAPTILPPPEGDYQYGFRVPLLVVSAYTPPHYIDNGIHDFGSILRFVEYNFGIKQGALNFADARSADRLAGFFNFNQAPRTFHSISTQVGANFFLNDKRPPTDPDDD